MLLIDCPWCGLRPEIEFAYASQSHIARPASLGDLTDQQWANYLYRRDNTKGIHGERWRHVHGCAQFFNALRDTTTDHFVATYRIGTPKPNTDESP